MIIAWGASVSHDDLIKSLAGAKAIAGPATITLDVTGYFLQSYTLLCCAEWADMLDALASAPITHVRFSSIRLSPKDDVMAAILAFAALRQLCSVVATLPSLTSAHLYLNNLEGAVCQRIITSLRHLKEISLVGATKDFQAVVRSLVGHKSLECLVLSIPTSLYTEILPSITKMTTLKEIQLSTEYRSITRRDAEAVSKVLRSGIPVNVSLKYFTFADESSQQVLLQGIAAANVKGIDFDGGIFASAATLSGALAGSHVQSIRFSRGIWFQNHGSWLSFYTSLADALPSMLQLREVNCSLLNGIKASQEADYEDALVVLVRAVAKHPLCKTFRMDLMACSETFDLALAECIRRNPSIKELEIRLRIQPSSAVPSALPAVLDAARTNYTLFKACFTTIYPNTPATKSPWDCYFTKAVTVMVELNKAGRGYVVTDPAHQYIGSRVLARVNNNLDCIMSHLMENPILCKRAEV